MNMIALYSRNRYEWNVVEHACNAYKGVVVPLYDTLGPDTVQFILNQTGLKTVCCEGKVVDTVRCLHAPFPFVSLSTSAYPSEN